MCTDKRAARRRHGTAGRASASVWLITVALAVASVLLAGCGNENRSAGAASSSAGESRDDADWKSDQGIRRDKELVKKYFPELGDFDDVVWKGEILGDARSVMPGPSDIQVSGVVRLADADATKLRQDYIWQAEPGTPVVLSDVRSYVPKSAQWQTSMGFTTAVTEGRYSARFYADFDQKVIVFDARNPRKKTL
jgi:predicted small secreted protein